MEDGLRSSRSKQGVAWRIGTPWCGQLLLCGASGGGGYGLGKCRYLGLAKYAVQSLLVAMVMNLKRMVRLLCGVTMSSELARVAQGQPRPKGGKERQRDLQRGVKGLSGTGQRWLNPRQKAEKGQKGARGTLCQHYSTLSNRPKMRFP